MLWKQLITWHMAIKHTWLTWFKASANSFWFIPHKFATFFWHLWCTFIPHSKRNIRMVIQASGKYCLTLQQKGLFLCAVQKLCYKTRLDMDLSLLIKLQFSSLTQWRLQKLFKRKKTPIIIILFSKSFTIKIILPFCGRITKMVFTVNTFNTLLGAILSQDSPNFSYSQSSNFDYTWDYSPAACFPTPLEPSAYLSLSSIKAFSTTHGWDESHSIQQTYTNAPCVAIANLL